MTWNEFIHMGGYGAYVWTSYALAGVVLLWNIVSPLLRRREVMGKLENWYRQEDRAS